MWVVELEGGTLTSSAGDRCVAASTAPVGGGNVVVGWGLVVGTLLGPEGTGDCFFVRASCLSYRPGVRGLAVRVVE